MAIIGFAFFCIFSINCPSAWAEDSPAGAVENGGVGPQGPVGVQGSVGAQGEIGSDGLVGPQGPVGVQKEVQDVSNVSVTEPDSVPSDSPSLVNDTTQINENTGSGSNNQNTSSQPDDSNVLIEDNSTINNNVDLKLNTGENQIGENTVVGNTYTGDIEGAVNLVNVSNSQFAPGSSVGSQLVAGADTNQIILIPSSNRIFLDNTNTGPDSQNLNVVDNPNVIKVFDLNNAINNNTIEIAANTGKNEIFSNTVAGDLTTGDIDLGVNLVNIANLLMPNTLMAIDIWNVLGPYSGNVVIPELANLKTGPGSNNQNLLTSSNQVEVDIVQNANLENTFDINTNTANNQVGNNTVAGDLSTGESVVRTALTNLANIVATPVFYLFNVFGTWSGSLLGLDPGKVIVNQINNKTGPDSQNNNSTNLNNSIDLSIGNNANINNKIGIDADTGNNVVRDSTLVGDINTGSIAITANVVNILNSMSREVGQFALRIINIFGDFDGDITPEPVNPVGGGIQDGIGGGSSTVQTVKGGLVVEENIDSEVTLGDGNVQFDFAEEENVFGPTTRFVSEQLPASGGNLAKANGASTKNPETRADNLSQGKNIFSSKVLIALIVLSSLILGWLAFELLALKYRKKIIPNK